MIQGEYWKLQDDAAIKKIDAAAVLLLSESGCRIEHDGLLRTLEGASCRVDYAARRCYFPEKLIRGAIAHLGPKASHNVEMPGGWSPRPPTNAWHGGSYPHLLDWPSGRRRLATREDVINMAKMAHVLPEFGLLGKVLTASDVDQRVEPLWATLQLAKISNKAIGGGEIFHADYIEPLVRMGEVITGKKNDGCLVASCDFFIAPLIFDAKQAECFLTKRRFGIENVPGTMPISGISAPVTLAGTVVIAVAELLAGWVMGYVVNPDLPVRAIVASGSLDMRTMAACFGSPEAMLQDATVVDLCQRLYGLKVHAATGYVDCKRPGLEAVFQKMMPLVGAPIGTGLNVGGQGLLSAGQDYSPVQHLLDLEIGQAVDRFWGHYEVNDDTIAADLIAEMITRTNTNFLDTDHTAAHYASQQWYPRWFDRSLWQGEEIETQAEQKMLQRIDDYCKDAIRRYEPPAVDQARIAELTRIFRAAERRILGENVTAV